MNTADAVHVRRTIVIAEDDLRMRSLLSALAERAGLLVLPFASGLAFMTWAQSVALHDDDVVLVITDVNMPGCNGLDVLGVLRARGSQVPAIVITAFGDEETHARGKSVGAIVLDKPFDLGVLRKSFALHASL